MRNPKVYLAGPITGLNYDGCTNWRDKVKEDLAVFNVDGASPMRGKAYLQGTGPIGDAYAETILSTEQAIMARDRYDVMSSDMVIFNFLGASRVTIGTCIEVGWADAFRKPSVLVIEETGNIHDHAMVRQACGWRVTNLDDAVRVVAATLLN